MDPIATTGSILMCLGKIEGYLNCIDTNKKLCQKLSDRLDSFRPIIGANKTILENSEFHSFTNRIYDTVQEATQLIEECTKKKKTSKKIVSHIKMMYSYLSGEVSASIKIDNEITAVLSSLKSSTTIDAVQQIKDGCNLHYDGTKMGREPNK